MENDISLNDDYLYSLLDLKEDVFTRNFSDIVNTLKFYDLETLKHCVKVGQLSRKIIKEIGGGYYQSDCAYLTGLLHEIGKCFMDNNILASTSYQTSKQYILNRHVHYGYNIFKDMEGLELVAKYIRHYCERYDGSGYPNRLRSFNIPLVSRVVAIADDFDNQIREKEDLSNMEILSNMKNLSGSRFDPNILDYLVKILS